MRVHLGNFEVERQWADAEIGLPRTSTRSSTVQVNRMDELAIPLAAAGDHVVCKATPDPGFLDQLRAIGVAVPAIIAVGGDDATRTVTEDALASPAGLAALSALAGPERQLAPHGCSTMEEQLAARTGLSLATPPAAVCKAVNSKVYSRRLATELGLRQPTGWACGDLSELDAAVRGATTLLEQGRRIAVKDAFGVSGNGIAVIDDPRRLGQVHRMVRSMAQRRGTDRIGLVVEEWVPNGGDLSYQFTVDPDGTVDFHHLSQAQVRDGVHAGNQWPAQVGGDIEIRVRRCAAVIGARLYADGYHGVVGVDAMLDPDGGLYPVTEINARHTMLTYFAALADQVAAPGLLTMARRYPLRLAGPVAFERLWDGMSGLWLDQPGGCGMVCHGFATVNADAPALPGGAPFAGRLHALLVASSPQRLSRLDTEVAARLATLSAGVAA